MNIKRLGELRKEIDEIDREISILLAERFSIAKKIGRIKKKLGVPIRDKKRENEILRRVSMISPTYSKNIVSVFKEIIKNSLKIQR